MSAREITDAIRAARGDAPALVAFLTAGHPSRDGWADTLAAVAEAADVVEIGVPFSDPMADGVTIQNSSRAALEAGVTLRWILDTLAEHRARVAAPVLLMSYLNPIVRFGVDAFASAAREAGVDGLIVPDLPLEESIELRTRLDEVEAALVQIVTPVTPADRARRLADASSGFLYAVTTTGITGGNKELPEATTRYLDAIRSVSSVPVCAGFGIRRAEQVRALAPHADGVIVGSALVEVLERGEDPRAFLGSLRAGHPAGEGHS